VVKNSAIRQFGTLGNSAGMGLVGAGIGLVGEGIGLVGAGMGRRRQTPGWNRKKTNKQKSGIWKAL
jgi:hypothetical protein